MPPFNDKRWFKAQLIKALFIKARLVRAHWIRKPFIAKRAAPRIASWLFQALLLLSFWFGVSYWQEKDLLASAEPAPNFRLPGLRGGVVDLQQVQAERTLLYFFAPWCSVCKLSIDNLDALRRARSEQELAIFAIALGYQSVREIEAFIDDQRLQVPVLLGSPETLQAFRIELFPTYYVLDAKKHVISKSVGYSTEFGLRGRT